MGLQVGNSVRGAIKDPVALADGSYVQCDNTRLTPFRYPHYSYHLCCVFFFFCLSVCMDVGSPLSFPTAIYQLGEVIGVMGDSVEARV